LNSDNPFHQNQEKAWLVLGPIGKRANGNLLFEQVAGLGRAAPMRLGKRTGVR